MEILNFLTLILAPTLKESNIYLINQARGPFRKLWTKFFPLALWPNRVRCSPSSKGFLSDQFPPRHNCQSSQRSLEHFCFSNVRPTLARKWAPSPSQTTESHSRCMIKMLLPSSLTNQSALKKFSGPYLKVTDQSQHSYHRCHIRRCSIRINENTLILCHTSETNFPRACFLRMTRARDNSRHLPGSFWQMYPAGHDEQDMSFRAQPPQPILLLNDPHGPLPLGSPVPHKSDVTRVLSSHSQSPVNFPRAPMNIGVVDSSSSAIKFWSPSSVGWSVTVARDAPCVLQTISASSQVS